MSDPSAAAQLQAKLQALWESSKGMILERLETLQAAHRQLSSDISDPHARQQGLEAAHKLAGILGVFGMPEGSETASQIEHLLKQEQSLTQANLKPLHQLTEHLSTIIKAKSLNPNP